MVEMCKGATANNVRRGRMNRRGKRRDRHPPDMRSPPTFQRWLRLWCTYKLSLCLFADRQALVDCYLPHIRPTQSCTEAFDKYFRNFVSEKQYRNACR